MAIARYSGVTTTANATVTVYLENTQVPATIYADALLTPLGNPFTSGVDGAYDFFADDAEAYDITENAPGDPLPPPSYDPFAFGVVAVAGQDNVEANRAHATLELVAGENIELTTDAANREVTISVPDFPDVLPVLTTDPVPPVNNTGWLVYDSGTGVIYLRARIGGNTYDLASVAL